MDVQIEINDLAYRPVGDYELPNLTVPESPRVGKYGRMYLRHLWEQRGATYTGLLLTGRLKESAEAVDREAGAMAERLVRDMAAAQGVAEGLKATDQMAWVGAMNNIRSAAEEIVLQELVYA